MNSLRTPITASRRWLFATLLVVPCTVAAFVAGCGDDDDVVATQDAGTDAAKDGNVADTSVPKDTGSTDTGAPSDAGDAGDANVDDGGALALKQARGKYIVEAVVGCSDCHTPRDQNGPIMAKFLSGVDCFVDVDGPATDGGCLSSANLTNDPTGLKNRTDDQIKNMFMNGVRPSGQNLVPVMPYYTLHNLTPADADAIVAYLRTVPGVDHTARPNDPPFTAPASPATPVSPATIPTSSDAGLDAGGNVDNGKYLAQLACLECHTKHTQTALPIDMTKPFAGGEEFLSAQLGLPTPPFPSSIISANITPADPTGLHGWTIEEIKKVMTQGLDRGDGGICPPMPAGPMAAFGHLTAQDALDIASYVHNLPPVANMIDGGSGSCVAPAGP